MRIKRLGDFKPDRALLATLFFKVFVQLFSSWSHIIMEKHRSSRQCRNIAWLVFWGDHLAALLGILERHWRVYGRSSSWERWWYFRPGLLRWRNKEMTRIKKLVLVGKNWLCWWIGKGGEGKKMVKDNCYLDGQLHTLKYVTLKRGDTIVLSLVLNI